MDLFSPYWTLTIYILPSGSDVFAFCVKLGLPHCMGYFYLLVLVRGCPIVPCFEHVRAGGGGGVV